jgi:hypothetical protein
MVQSLFFSIARFVSVLVVVGTHSQTYAQMPIQAKADGEMQAHPPTPLSPPIQVEVHGGNNKLLFQTIIIKPIDPEQRFDFFNISTFDYHWTPEEKFLNEGIIQSYVAYNFIKGVGIGVGATYNSFAGLSPNIVGQVVNAGRQHLVVFFAAAHLQEKPQYQGFLQLQYRPSISEDVRLFSQLMVLTNWVQFESHSRSFQQLRIGLEYKTFQFGVGTDINQYGPTPESKLTIGLFIRTELFH